MILTVDKRKREGEREILLIVTTDKEMLDAGSVARRLYDHVVIKQWREEKGEGVGEGGRE